MPLASPSCCLPYPAFRHGLRELSHLLTLSLTSPRELPGMSRCGPNLKQSLAAISKADRTLREHKAAAEQERLLMQAQSKSRKIGEAEKVGVRA